MAGAGRVWKEPMSGSAENLSKALALLLPESLELAREQKELVWWEWSPDGVYHQQQRSLSYLLRYGRRFLESPPRAVLPKDAKGLGRLLFLG